MAQDQGGLEQGGSAVHPVKRPVADLAVAAEDLNLALHSDPVDTPDGVRG